MVKIPESRTYKSLGEIADPAERLRIAGEAGRGLAIYGDLTCRMRTDGLENPLPGYRDTRLYFNQLRSVLAGCRTPEEAGALLPTDPTVRQSTEEHFLVHLDEPEYRRRAGRPGVPAWIDLVRSRGGVRRSTSSRGWSRAASGASRSTATPSSTTSSSRRARAA